MKPLSAQLERAMEKAQELAEAEKAPAVRFDHFLLAAIWVTYEPHAEDVLKVARSIIQKWKEE